LTRVNKTIISMNELGGQWSGTIKAAGKELQMKVNFTVMRINDATISLPGHEGKFVPLTNAEYQPPKIHLECVTVDNRSVFGGTLNNNKIAGSFSQNYESGSFELTKVSDEGKDKDQHINSNLNYPQ
jgi:uncharacterized protein